MVINSCATGCAAYLDSIFGYQPMLIANYILKHKLSVPVFLSLFQQRIEIQKLREGDNLILGFSIGGGIDQDANQNPFSEDKADKVKNHV